jgi:hypothetical protein
MKSKIIFTLLFMLSFNTFHDYLITLMDKSDHTSIVLCLDQVSAVSDTDTTAADYEKIHSMFHFMAIMIPHDNNQIHYSKKETIAHSLQEYTPPFKKSSYKPPTA